MFFQGKSFNATNFKEIWDSLSPLSPYGKDYKAKVKATTIVNRLQNEYMITDKLLQIILRHPDEMLCLRNLLSQSKDVLPLVNKAYKGLVLEEEEFFNLKSWLLLLGKLQVSFLKLGISEIKNFKIYNLNQCLETISPGNQGPSFYLVDSLSEKLAQLRKENSKTKKQLTDHIDKLKNQIEQKVSVKFNIENKLKVSKFELELLKSLRKQEGINYYGESYSHMEFKLKLDDITTELNRKIDVIKLEIEKEEYALRDKLTKGIIPYIPIILKNCRKIGKFDWTLAKAYYAKDIRGTVPQITTRDIISIKGGRNPILESVLAKRNRKATAINIEVKRGVTIITGANMGGKSLALKTTGLFIALAQHGLLVPCDFMFFNPRKFIYYSQSDGQSIYNGLSTFGWEIGDIKKALTHRNKRGIYLIDELARGTNPLEGGALALSIARYLDESNSTTIMTTHFEELVRDEFKQLRVVGLSKVSSGQLKKAMNNKEGIEAIEGLMDYNLEEMNEMRLPKEGVKIAALMGLPKEIIEYAKKIISQEGRRNYG